MVWEWHAYEHLDLATDHICPLDQRHEWTHGNACEVLPNGNTLICEGMTGRLFEVTHAGEIVWEYVNPFFGGHRRFGRVNIVFRAYRYAPDFPGLQGKALQPERHAWLNRLQALLLADTGLYGPGSC